MSHSISYFLHLIVPDIILSFVTSLKIKAIITRSVFFSLTPQLLFIFHIVSIKKHASLFIFFFYMRCTPPYEILLFFTATQLVKTVYLSDPLFATHFIKRSIVVDHIPEYNHNPIHEKCTDNSATQSTQFIFCIYNGV